MSKSRKKRNEVYKEAIAKMNEYNVRLGVAMKMIKGGYYSQPAWEDDNSPTGYTQVCDYFGTCQSPCNGDC